MPSQPSSSSSPLENEPWERKRHFRLSLFWRTFILLSLLLIGTTVTWLQSLRVLELEPRTLYSAQQIVTLVNLSRALLINTNEQTRAALLRTMSEQEGMRIHTRQPSDRYEPMDTSTLGVCLTEQLKARLGDDTLVAQSVNSEPGLWVSFRLEDGYRWLQMERAHFNPTNHTTMVQWIGISLLLSLTGAAVITRLLNKPIQQLSDATHRISQGDFTDSRLDEKVATSEIRDLNIGFNRMADRLAKTEENRAIMLAGISHDLRTPLARLRLETEMSVSDDVAREHMVADIAQLDAIIDKFMDYARPVSGKRHIVHLLSIINTCVFPQQNRTGIKIDIQVSDTLCIYADKVELARVINNLLENAHRYGKTPGTETAWVEIASSVSDKHVFLTVRDHGPGAPPEELNNLLKPFFRGDTARTAAVGTGLGLSIVEKTIQRMGGKFALSNAETGGLCAHIRLDMAPSRPPGIQQTSRFSTPSSNPLRNS